MKKIVSMMLMMAVVFLLCSCGNKAESENAKENSDTKETQIQSEEKVENKEIKSETEIKNEKEAEIFTGAEGLYEVPMGTCIDGNQKKLFTVKIPVNYLAGMMYTNEKGQYDYLPSCRFDALSVFIEEGVFDGDNVTSIISVSNNDNHLELSSFVYDPSDIEASKAIPPETATFEDLGINGDFHNWVQKYDGTYPGDIDKVFYYCVYKDEWMVVVDYKGVLSGKKTDKEIAEKINAILTDL